MTGIFGNLRAHFGSTLAAEGYEDLRKALELKHFWVSEKIMMFDTVKSRAFRGSAELEI